MKMKPPTLALILLISLLASNGIVLVAMARELQDPLGHSDIDHLSNKLERLSRTIIRRSRPPKTPPPPLRNQGPHFSPPLGPPPPPRCPTSQLTPPHLPPPPPYY
uniref:Uncharacterized protein n=1 Tax=Opuntia streptacantha TaxID=393608 RepID=A0A7C8ZUD7_OPUST